VDCSLKTGYDQPMKPAFGSSGKQKPGSQPEIFTLSHAKTYLGRLIDKAGKGQTVYIVRGQQRFLLQPVPPIDPIPIRPPGYFEGCYTKTEIQEENRLAKASVIHPPKDLE
jgi:hypothetical protein